MDGKDRWDPSGRAAVYDAAMNLVGHTTLRIEVDELRLSRPTDSKLVGEVRRVLLDTQDGSPRYWIYWVRIGDPADVPGFTPLTN